MFVGHYAVSFAFKAKENKTSIFWLFIAVQFLDIVFFPLTLLGIEKFSIIENFTESTHFSLDYMPYSHGLVSVLIWSVVTYVFLKFLVFRQSKERFYKPLLISAAIMSHWWLDLIVHIPDLPLLSNDSIKVGFGLWNYALLTYALEATILLVALYLYMKSTYKIGRRDTKLAKYGMPIFVIILLLLNVVNLFGPLASHDTEQSTAISAIIAYGLFASIAYFLDKKRSLKR
jgi:hypothetical protein